MARLSTTRGGAISTSTGIESLRTCVAESEWAGAVEAAGALRRLRPPRRPRRRARFEEDAEALGCGVVDSEEATTDCAVDSKGGSWDSSIRTGDSSTAEE